MSPLGMGLIVLGALLALLSTGMPIAFALGLVSILALVVTDGFGTIELIGEIFFGGLESFALVSIPMFIVMGAAIASSPAGKDLYEALDRWLNRVPGGLVLSNIGACSIFAALSGSSPATCAAIGKMGIPEMVDRGYPKSIAAGSIAAGGTLGILIPPSVTMIVYGIATETSIGRLFIAGLLPGLMLTILFMIWTIIACRMAGYSFEQMAVRYSLRERLQALVSRIIGGLVPAFKLGAGRAPDHMKEAIQGQTGIFFIFNDFGVFDQCLERGPDIGVTAFLAAGQRTRIPSQKRQVGRKGFYQTHGEPLFWSRINNS